MTMKLTQNLRHSNQGFTIVELLVAMVVALLALGAICSTFLNQQKSYAVQGETAAMHQNIRAGMFYMQREIRMAGCDPTGKANAGIPPGEAKATSIRFTEDVTNVDGVINVDKDEDITYGLDGNRNLIRTDNNAGETQMVSQNIDALDFVYFDGNSNVLNPGGINVPAGSEDQIRSVEVTIVARTDRTTLASKNNTPYYNQQGDLILAPQDDNYSRRRLTARIKCRNLGI